MIKVHEIVLSNYGMDCGYKYDEALEKAINLFLSENDIPESDIVTITFRKPTVADLIYKTPQLLQDNNWSLNLKEGI